MSLNKVQRSSHKLWLIKTVINDRVKISCKWPPSPIIVTSETIKIAVEPSPEWPIYSIRLADNGKEYSNFNKAWYQKFLINSGTSSSEAEIRKKKSYKRSKIISQHLSSDSDSCEESYQICNTADNSGLKTTIGNISINDTSKVHIDSSIMPSTSKKFSVDQNLVNPFMFSSDENPENEQFEKDGHRMTSMKENANNLINATTKCLDATRRHVLIIWYHHHTITYHLLLCICMICVILNQIIMYSKMFHFYQH
eukprot:XP_016658402.1 PREDICTED: uncharacterized protein LOC107883254 [Acyrthosiphon pisum]